MYSIGVHTTTDLDPVLPQMPGVWRAADLAPQRHTTPTGYRALNQALPGGGWPCSSLIGIQCPRPGLEWRLLAPTLRQASQQGLVLLLDPPLRPHLGALVAAGVHMPNLWWVRSQALHDTAWVVEHALRCEHLATLLLWPNTAWPHASWQRLQRACARATHNHPPLTFVLSSNPQLIQQTRAPLQLALTSLGAWGLQVALTKRQGPPLPAPVVLHAPLPALPPQVTAPDHHAVDRLPTRPTPVSTPA